MIGLEIRKDLSTGANTYIVDSIAHSSTFGVLSRDDYYPFGLTFNHYSSGTSVDQNYLFNGVEQDQTTGDYEMMFRGYDPALGRFKQNDPLSEIIPGISPYHFGFNNPIVFSDPLGLMGETDLYGRAKTDSFTGMYIPPQDRPGGATAQGYGDPSQGSFKRVSETKTVSDGYNFHDANGNEELDDNESYFIRYESQTRYYMKWEWEENLLNDYSNRSAILRGAVGVGVALGERGYNYKKGGSWIGKDFKLRSSEINGNGATGGKKKFAGKVATGLKLGGWALGIYGIYDTQAQYHRDKKNGVSVNNARLVLDQISNGVSTFGGLYGASWGFGYEMGKSYGPSKWYGANDRKWFE